MTPFRYVPRMFFTLLLFVAAPIIYDLAIADNPTELMDCAVPKSAAEKNICEASKNLEQAQKNIVENLKNLIQSRR